MLKLQIIPNVSSLTQKYRFNSDASLCLRKLIRYNQPSMSVLKKKKLKRKLFFSDAESLSLICDNPKIYINNNVWLYTFSFTLN